MNRELQHLADHVDSLQAKGNYFLSKNSLKSLFGSENALRSSIKRLVKKKRLVSLKRGFYLIIPVEYKNIGAPPPDWFIDQLMREYGVKYYVALLTAAAFHGAAHQQPQIYQVITNKPMRPLKIGRVRIVFYYKKDFPDIGFVERKTPTGYIQVSSPELTAFDLVRYLKQSGYMNHVSTVLTELGEEINSKKLSELAPHFPPACIQRVGYILDEVGFSEKTNHLLKYVHSLSSRYFPLRPDKTWTRESKNKKWRLYINEQLEPDI